MVTTKHQRFWFRISSVDQWYAIMRECRAWFGTNWRSESRVRKRLPMPGQKMPFQRSINVWFDVPDERFATWVSVKLSLQVCSDSKREVTK